MSNFVAMIDHQGIIDHIDGGIARVKIISESACAACHAKGVCGAADQEEKFIDVSVERNDFVQGESVRVLVARKLGMKAVLLGYVYPLLVLLVVLFTLISSGMEELKAAPLALLSLPAYYLVLYLARGRIDKEFSFSIMKLKY